MFLIVTLYGNKPLKSLLSDMNVPLSGLPAEVLETFVPAARIPLSNNPNERSAPQVLIESACQGVGTWVIPDDKLTGPDAYACSLNLFDPKVVFRSFSFIIALLCSSYFFSFFFLPFSYLAVGIA
jgi:hypothetical protein